MRIGLYGGLSNSMYLLAKIFHKKGHDVVFIRNFEDSFVFSQPCWDDIEVTLPYKQVISSATWSHSDWDSLEKEWGWKKPSFLCDLFDNEISTKPKTILDYRYLIYKFFEIKRKHWRKVRSVLSDCDIILVSGVNPVIIASMTGKPYIFMPYGQDMRTAAGHHPPTGHGLKVNLFYRSQQVLLKSAVKRALWVATCDPTGGGCSINHDVKNKLKFKSKSFSFPFSCDFQYDKYAARHELISRFDLAGDIANSVILFIPSRIDFFWKKTDLFLNAVISICKDYPDNPFYIIFSGWGEDRKNAIEIIRKNKCDRIIFLDYVLSKPLLYKMFKASDLVVDQFMFGTYGSSAVESMSVGTPVMMHIDTGVFKKAGMEPPPVLNCKTQEGIEATLIDILNGKIDLKDMGKKALDWYCRVHAVDVTIPKLLNEIEEVISK